MKIDKNYFYIDERGEVIVSDVELTTLTMLANGFKLPNTTYLGTDFVKESLEIVNQRINFMAEKEKEGVNAEEFFKKYMIMEE